MTGRRILAALLVPSLLLWGAPGIPGARAQAPPAPPGAPSPDDQPPPGLEATPPRVGFISGEVAFWRPGATDWAPARVNTPVVPGDLLYTGNNGNVELQIGSRAFARAAPGTQLGLENLEPDFVQFRVTSGHFSLDLRDLAAGTTIEVDTPNAVLTVERTGYYRVSVGESATTFITRRGGRAMMTPAGGAPVAITPSEHIVVTGTDTPHVETYVAPELSDWDRWNYARTDYLLEAVSARYVPPGVYGARDLDRYGNWRVTQEYGAVWVPDSTPPGWAPYSSGRWVWDPMYGWTWVDDAPWGWAPYHYGRWVFVGGFWAWTPGPIVVRPIYAPALVVFLGGFAIGRPLAWVALGWGEPCVPWWGPPGFIGSVWWGGWGGPRVVNNVVINRTTVVNVTNITVYKNTGVRDAVVAVRADRFGREPVSAARITRVDVPNLSPVHGALDVKPAPASLVPASGPAVRPPDAVHRRAVVGTRSPRRVAATPGTEVLPKDTGVVQQPPPRLVPPPPRAAASTAPERPPFGKQSAPERPRPPEPPRLEGSTRTGPARGDARQVPADSERQQRGVRPSRPDGMSPTAPPSDSGRRTQTEPGPERRGAPAPSPGAAPSAQAPPAPRSEAPAAQRPSAGRTERPQAPAPSAQAPPAPRSEAPAAQRPSAGRTERPQAPAAPAPRAQTPRAPAPETQAPDRKAPPVPATTPPRAEGVERQRRTLPGEPANRLFPGQGERRVERQAETPAARPAPAQPSRKVEPQAPGSPGGAPDGGGQRGGGRN